MGKKEQEQENYSSMVNNNAMLLSFEGWIKYIEGFVRGLQATKTVDACTVMDCVGEILEYMTRMRNQLLGLLQHCESILEKNEELEKENKKLKLLLNGLEDKNGKEVSTM